MRAVGGGGNAAGGVAGAAPFAFLGLYDGGDFGGGDERPAFPLEGEDVFVQGAHGGGGRPVAFGQVGIDEREDCPFEGGGLDDVQFALGVGVAALHGEDAGAVEMRVGVVRENARIEVGEDLQGVVEALLAHGDFEENLLGLEIRLVEFLKNGHGDGARFAVALIHE